MNNVRAVIRREYLQRIRTKWFIISTVGGPLLMAGLIFIPAVFAARGERAERNLALLDLTGVLAEELAPRLEEASFEVEVVPPQEYGVEILTQRVNDGELGGYLVVDSETLRSGSARFYADSNLSTLRRLSMRSAIVTSALERHLEGQGVDASAMLQGGELDVMLLSPEGARMDEGEFAVGYTGAFLLYMVILLYSVAVMRATLEEKTSRIVEVIVSSMKPWHLMLGKIMGVGAVGLTQLGVWVISSFLIFSAGVPALIAARPELADLEQLRELLPGAAVWGLFVGYFVFGYFMYSGLYAAVGAMCNSDEEAQQAQFPVMMILVIPLLFITAVIQAPASPLSTGMSLFPFFSPVLMFPRIVAGAAPWWQIGASFVLMALAVLGVAWVAGRIYKVGMLMAGKRPTLPELWRWVREA